MRDQVRCSIWKLPLRAVLLTEVCALRVFLVCEWIGVRYCRSRDWTVTGRCPSFWLSDQRGDVSRQVSTDTRVTHQEQRNGHAGVDRSTNVVAGWRSPWRRCAVARAQKRTSTGNWRTQHAREQCSSLNCFVCHRRELLSVSLAFLFDRCQGLAYR